MKILLMLILGVWLNAAVYQEKDGICISGVLSNGVCETPISCVEGIASNGLCLGSAPSGITDVYSLSTSTDTSCSQPNFHYVEKIPEKTTYLGRNESVVIVDKIREILEMVSIGIDNSYPASWFCPQGYTLGEISNNVNKCEYSMSSSNCPSGQTWNPSLKACEGWNDGILVPGNAQVVDYTKKEAGTSYTNKTSTTETVPLDAVQIITGSRAGSYAQWNKTSTANQRAYVMWVAGENGPECWNGWKPWENFSKYNKDKDKNRDNYYHKVDNSRCEYYLGTYNIYGIKYICPPSAQDWDWKVDESAGNCKRVVVVCPVGYTETVGAEIANGGCKKNVTICPVGYTETVGAEIAKGECKKNITYPYYKYSCPVGYDAPKNPGQTTVPVRTDSNGTTINNELSNPYNSSTLPKNNCYIKTVPVCPSGGVLTSNSCELSSNLKCPSGGVLNGTTCKVSTEGKCPTGFSINADSCTKEILKCPSGFEEASDLTCKKTTYSCPMGSIEEGTMCKREVKAQCPTGYEEKAGKCQKEILNPNCNSVGKCTKEEITCPDKSYLKDGKCITEKTPICQIGYIYNPLTQNCETEGYCPTGYIDLENKGCRLDYTYSLYSCLPGWEGPLDTGLDCGGSQKECNPSTPPANNCKQPISTKDKIEIKKFRDMESHIVTGSVVEKEYGVIKGFNSGKDSTFGVTKIEGVSNSLCFTSRNGSEECIAVDGCTFNGKIEMNTYPNLIQELNLSNQYTLSLEVDNPVPIVQEDGLLCPEGMQYDKNKKFCISPENNFYNWVGFGADGNWKVLNAQEVFQTVNVNGFSFFYNPVKYPKDVLMQGMIRVEDGGVDDDAIGLVFDYKDYNNYKLIGWDNGGDFPQGLVYGERINGVFNKISHHPLRWKTNVAYNIKVLYNLDKVQVFINDTLYIDYKNTETNINDMGYAGFFNSSQGGVRYWNFKIETKPTCTDNYTWNPILRVCSMQPNKTNAQSIISTCKMNGHVGWHSRKEGIVSAIVKQEKDRIKFWDSYTDKDLGFIEFVKDVKAEDREEGYIPTNNFLYEMLAGGFTASDTVDGNTIFSSATTMSSASCSQLSAKYGIPKSNEVTSGTTKLMKELSGNRYKQLEVKPDCLNGLYVESLKLCVNINTESGSCPNGKYDNINGFTWDNAQGNTVTAYTSIYAPTSGVYDVKITTKGRVSLYIDGNINDVVAANANPLLYKKIFLEAGLHEIKILGEKDIYHANGNLIFSGEKGFLIEITDELGAPISKSTDWCKNTESLKCPNEGGFIKLGNVCLEKSVPFCKVGKINEITSTCIIEPKCVLAKAGEMTYREQKESVKIEYRDSEVMSFACSPLKCVNNYCQTATCPSGNPPFEGHIIGAGMTPIKAEECINNTCDANKPYYEYCGRKAGCPQGNPMIFEDEAGNCKEMYCPNGQIFDSSTMKCKKLECPENAVLQPDGSCKRK